ncbi:MAG: hypothetical protein QM831_22390 [Kofleriaceae bacterium]
MINDAKDKAGREANTSAQISGSLAGDHGLRQARLEAMVRSRTLDAWM